VEVRVIEAAADVGQVFAGTRTSDNGSIGRDNLEQPTARINYVFWPGNRSATQRLWVKETTTGQHPETSKFELPA